MVRRMKGKGEERERKKPGPVANPNLVVTSVSLEADLLEWGKLQPGGLSALLRRLLKEAREEANSKGTKATE
jgi:hypothetical protein